MVAGSYFDRNFAYEADATDYEFSLNPEYTPLRGDRNPPPPFCLPNFVAYDFGGDPRGFATNDEDTEIETLEVRLQSTNDSESRWSWLGGAFYSKETRPHRIQQLRARLRRHAVLRLLQLLRAISDRHPLVGPTCGGWASTDTETEQRALFGEVAFDVTENFTITAGGRWFEYDTKFASSSSPRRVQRGSIPDDAVDTDETARHEAEPELPHRRRPHGLRDLLGGIPQRRQQPGEANSILPRASAPTRSTTTRSAPRRSGWTTACASMSPPTSWSGTTSRSRSRIRRPQCSSSATSTCRPPKSGHRDGVHVRRQRRLADRRDARLQRRGDLGGDRADARGRGRGTSSSGRSRRARGFR